MPYQTSDYTGDAIYSLHTTGDVVTGDEISFDRATFSGSFRKPKFAGFERITGKVISDSYGAEKQQHTFTILQENGEKLLIKGRNLYAQGVYRKPWTDETARRAVADEKHQRGDRARTARAIRKSEQAMEAWS